MCVVDFGMIVEINKVLKEKGIEYSIHSIGGCASCGLALKKEGKKCNVDVIIDIMNDHLKKYWLKVRSSHEEGIFIVESQFHQNK